MRTLIGALALVLALPASALACSDDPARSADRPTTHDARAASFPALKVRRVVGGLDHPWDVQVLPDRSLLVTERDRARLSRVSHGVRRTVRFPSSKIWVSGETGLMSMAIDPGFTGNRRFYVCSGWQKPGGGHDVRVTAWRLSDSNRRARFLHKVIAGFPTSSGRHGGCRLLIADNGSMIVGTGDAAQTPNPQSLTSLGGKTLRLDPVTGRPWPTNEFVDADNRRKRFIHTYGHRNVQGLAQRRDGSLWNIEQGTYRDDEVNRLRNGGNYGWQPGPGYDETPPMTDFSLPGKQIGAKWSSGNPTRATSGGTFAYGQRWGRYGGTLAVCVLKDERVIFMKFGPDGALKWTRAPRKLREHGRIRSATLTPGHDLLLTTDNGAGSDVLLRVSPR